MWAGGGGAKGEGGAKGGGGGGGKKRTGSSWPPGPTLVELVPGFTDMFGQDLLLSLATLASLTVSLGPMGGAGHFGTPLQTLVHYLWTSTASTNGHLVHSLNPSMFYQESSTFLKN